MRPSPRRRATASLRLADLLSEAEVVSSGDPVAVDGPGSSPGGATGEAGRGGHPRRGGFTELYPAGSRLLRSVRLKMDCGSICLYRFPRAQLHKGTMFSRPPEVCRSAGVSRSVEAGFLRWTARVIGGVIPVLEALIYRRTRLV